MRTIGNLQASYSSFHAIFVFLPPPSGTFKHFSGIFKTFLMSVYIPLPIYCLILRFILYGRLLNHFLRISQFLVSFISGIYIISSNGSRNFTSFLKWHENNIKSLFWQRKYEFRNMSIPFEKGIGFWWRGSEEAISWLCLFRCSTVNCLCSRISAVLVGCTAHFKANPGRSKVRADSILLYFGFPSWCHSFFAYYHSRSKEIRTLSEVLQS